MAIEITLGGPNGQRTTTLSFAPPPQAPQPTPTAPRVSLTRDGLQRLLSQMPHRWYNAGELVIELQIHNIQTNHQAVTALLDACDVETRTRGNWTEYRRTDKKASEVHRRSCFACVRAFVPTLKRHRLTEADLWDAMKDEYNVASRSELDTPQWASLSATFQAAKRDAVLMNVLIKRVKAHKGGN